MLKPTKKKVVRPKAKPTKKPFMAIPKAWLVSGTFVIKKTIGIQIVGIYGWERYNDTFYSPMYLDTVTTKTKVFIKGPSVAKMKNNLPISIYDLKGKRIGTIQRTKSTF